MVCYNCFREKSSYGPCPLCGYDPSGAEEKFPLALKPGSILNGRYTVGRVLGQGGFGITYIAQDYKTKERVAIKEYLPTEFAGRDRRSSSVQIYSGERKDNFEYGKEQFLQEAKTLAAFIGDEHIVRIYSYFEENNTAYFVMEYVDGFALDKYMAQKGGRLSVEEANRLLFPLMGSLGSVHAKGIIHRDIAPDNIIVTKDSSAKLIDFGAARYSTGEKSKSLDVILKHGFAPREQYMRRGRQGPFTDVYALAATYYYAITGKVPPDAIERTEEDVLFPPSALGVKIPNAAEDALFKALEVNSHDRYQTMAEFYRAMADAFTAASSIPISSRVRTPEAQRTPASGAADPSLPQTGLSALEEAELLEKRAREIRAEAERQAREERERLAREEAARREQERREREAREKPRVWSVNGRSAKPEKQKSAENAKPKKRKSDGRKSSLSRRPAKKQSDRKNSASNAKSERKKSGLLPKGKNRKPQKKSVCGRKPSQDKKLKRDASRGSEKRLHPKRNL